jgi:hypothetical protein
MIRLVNRVVLIVTVAAALASPATVAYAGPGGSGWGRGGLPPYEMWISRVTEVLDEVEDYLDSRVSAEEDEKTALVLDIDNTALQSSYSSGGSLTPATPPVLRTALSAYGRDDVAIFFVTARGESYRDMTQYNLEYVGYPVDGLFLRPGIGWSSVQEYKINARMTIERMGYTIVANIGNNRSDVDGGHAERAFKLPDYNGMLG